MPVAEGRAVASALGSDYREVDGESHFFEPSEAVLRAVLDSLDRASLPAENGPGPSSA